jgi:hypothetical protein
VTRLLLVAVITLVACRGARPVPPVADESLAPALRSYLSPEVLAKLDQPDKGSGCARDPFVDGATQALEGKMYVETYHRARDPEAHACGRYRDEGALRCCTAGFAAATAALVDLAARWSATDFEPLEGGHTKSQVRTVGDCMLDLSRGTSFALRLCGASGPTEPGLPQCPQFDRATEIAGGYLGCWSAGLNQTLSTCSTGPTYRELEESRRACERPAGD